MVTGYFLSPTASLLSLTFVTTFIINISPSFISSQLGSSLSTVTHSNNTMPASVHMWVWCHLLCSLNQMASWLYYSFGRKREPWNGTDGLSY